MDKSYPGHMEVFVEMGSLSLTAIRLTTLSMDERGHQLLWLDPKAREDLGWDQTGQALTQCNVSSSKVDPQRKDGGEHLIFVCYPGDSHTFVGMSPLQHLRSQWRRDIQIIQKLGPRSGLPFSTITHSLLDLPGQRAKPVDSEGRDFSNCQDEAWASKLREPGWRERLKLKN